MKRLLAVAALLLPLFFVGCSHPPPYYPPPPPGPGYPQFTQQGFRDGVQAAQRDVAGGKPPRVDRHPRFRNPPVPPPAIEDYRRGFREGYEQVFRNGAPPPRY